MSYLGINIRNMQKAEPEFSPTTGGEIRVIFKNLDPDTLADLEAEAGMEHYKATVKKEGDKVEITGTDFVRRLKHDGLLDNRDIDKASEALQKLFRGLEIASPKDDLYPQGQFGTFVVHFDTAAKAEHAEQVLRKAFSESFLPPDDVKTGLLVGGGFKFSNDPDLTQGNVKSCDLLINLRERPEKKIAAINTESVVSEIARISDNGTDERRQMGRHTDGTAVPLNEVSEVVYAGPVSKPSSGRGDIR